MRSQRFSTLARALFAVSVLAATARFAWVEAAGVLASGVLTSDVLDEAARTAERVTSGELGAETNTDTSSTNSVEALLKAALEGTKPPAAAATTGRTNQVDMIRIMLSAKHSEDRSPVYVNEALVGHTSFMADFSCQRGEPLVVRIVPAQGPAIERKTKCVGPTVSVSD